MKAGLRPALFVPQNRTILKLLEMIKQERTLIAPVLDEYGVIQGLVTHDDILESIGGTVPSVGEPGNPLGSLGLVASLLEREGDRGRNRVTPFSVDNSACCRDIGCPTT